MPVVSTGIMAIRARDAAERLAADGIGVPVLHVPTSKPLDRDTILTTAAKGRLLVAVENHTMIGGRGEAVAATLIQAGVKPRFRRIGLPGEFLEAGALPTLHDIHGLSVDRVVATIRGGSKPQ